jgi:ubiquitin-activating enzyme E1
LKEKMQRVRTFVVGAGAIGCEMLKSFALMGLATHAEGSVTVTVNSRFDLDLF